PPTPAPSPLSLHAALPIYPFAPARHVASTVDVVAVRIGETGRVQPVDGEPLAQVRRMEQPVHHFFVGVRAEIRDKSIHLSRHRRSEEHTSELQSPCNLVCR